MGLVDQALTSIETRMHTLIDSVSAFRAIAAADESSGLVTITRLGASTDDSEAYARVEGFAIDENDEVLAIPINGKPVIIGRLTRASLPNHQLIRDTFINSDSQYALAVRTAAGNSRFRVDTSDNETQLWSGNDLVVYSDAGSTTVASIDGATGAAVFNAGVNSPFYRVSDSGADVNQTSASSTYVTIHSETFTLPTGTWTLRVTGALQLLCSTGARADIRLVVDGTNHDDTTDLLTTGTYETYAITQTKASVASGSTTVTLQFRQDTTGTVTANNGTLWIWAERTA